MRAVMAATVVVLALSITASAPAGARDRSAEVWSDRTMNTPVMSTPIRQLAQRRRIHVTGRSWHAQGRSWHVRGRSWNTGRGRIRRPKRNGRVHFSGRSWHEGGRSWHIRGRSW